MLHGLELAQKVVARLAAAKVADQALVLQMPGWASRTPTVPFAVAVTRGPLFHILAAVEVWKVIVAPPPALARFGGAIEWSNEGADETAVGAALTALAQTWWSEAPEAVGAFDVAGSVTHALTSALGDAHGTFGNTTYTELGPGEARRLAGCGIGRNGSSPRWPELASVQTRPHAIAITLTLPDGTYETRELSTVHELAAALPDIVTRLRATDDACVDWLALLAAARTSAERLCARLPGTWTATDPFEIEPTKPPTTVMRAPAEVGGSMGIHVTAGGAESPSEARGRSQPSPGVWGRSPDRAESLSVAVGTATFDLAEDNVAAIAAAVAIESRVVRASRLVEGESYRVTRAFGGASPGDVLVFRELAEVRPSGADMWFFRGEGRNATGVSLRSDVEEDRAVLDSLSDYLTR